MQPAKRTLAIVAITTTLVSCSNQSAPATTPQQQPVTPRVYATTATHPLASDLTVTYNASHPATSFETKEGNFQSMLDKLYKGEMAYFFSNHLSIDSSLWAIPIGQDGIAVVVNPEVPLEELTLEELRGIYQGWITSWAQVANYEQDITVFSREDGSGTRAEFERMVMGYRRTTSNARIAASSTQMIESVYRNQGSIGYVSMAFLDARVRAVAMEGTMPTRRNVQRNRYPLRSTLFIVGLSEPEDEYQAFITWIQGREGQRVVAKYHAPFSSDALEEN